MEKEVFFTGYCRQTDSSRMVAVEITDGTIESDCCYGSCPYQKDCTVAKSIAELEKTPVA